MVPKNRFKVLDKMGLLSIDKVLDIFSLAISVPNLLKLSYRKLRDGLIVGQQLTWTEKI